MPKLVNFGIAVLGSILAAALLYLAARSVFGIEETIAKGAASLPLGALPKFYDELEKVRAQSGKAKEDGSTIDTLEKFGLPWPAILIVSIIIFVAVANLATMYGGAMAALVSTHFDVTAADIQNMLILSILPLGIGYFLAARWIGARSTRYGVPVITVSFLLAITINRVVDAVFLPQEVIKMQFGVESAFSFEFLVSIGKILSIAVPVALTIIYFGYWLGRRTVTYRYMAYLLRMVPSTSRQALLELASAEAEAQLRSRRANRTLSERPATVVYN